MQTRKIAFRASPSSAAKGPQALEIYTRAEPGRTSLNVKGRCQTTSLGGCSETPKTGFRPTRGLDPFCLYRLDPLFVGREVQKVVADEVRARPRPTPHLGLILHAESILCSKKTFGAFQSPPQPDRAQTWSGRPVEFRTVQISACGRVRAEPRHTQRAVEVCGLLSRESPLGALAGPLFLKPRKCKNMPFSGYFGLKRLKEGQ